MRGRRTSRISGWSVQAEMVTIVAVVTVLLAGMLLSNLVEEKSNKVIEVLAAAIPVDAIFLGKLFAMLGVSLVGQGLLLSGALKRMGLIAEDPVSLEVADHQARLIASRAAHLELESLHSQGLVPRAAYEHLRSDYQVNIARAERELRRLNEQHLAQGARSLIAVRRRLIDAERTSIQGARRSGLIPEATAEHMLARLDERTLELEHALRGNDDATPDGGRKA